ncbi:MAG: HEPN domain-containing protein [Candidatus Pacebacteria bacterium]|nr:HEPN domain-containing protein [Candidatus Paceibacterota bacterium]
MIDCNDLKKIAQMRLKEAKVLYKAGFYDGAIYLCGYVVETSLKAMICKNLKINEYPDDGKDKSVFSSHDFDRLLLLSGLSKRINANNRRKRELFSNWSILTQWKPEGRYTPIGKYKQNDVKEFLKALEDKKDDFFVFIKKIW